MISVLYNIILITNFKLIEMCIKSSPTGEGMGEGPVVAGFGPLVAVRGASLCCRGWSALFGCGWSSCV